MAVPGGERMTEEVKERCEKIKQRELEEKRNHIEWDYYLVGRNATIERDEANEIIEEIISILRKKCITVQAAKQILQDTISSIEKEAVLDKML